MVNTKWLLGFIASTCISLTTSSFINPNTDVQSEFIQFLSKFGKSYSNKDELVKRFQIFERNYKLVTEHNSQQGIAFTLEINQFADQDSSEYLPVQQYPLIENTPLQEIQLAQATLGQSYSPIDWRTKGKVAPPLNQGSCGSCWAFSAANALESAIAIKLGADVNQCVVSPQHLLDCDTEGINMGCNGGLQSMAFDFIKSNGYILMSDYPAYNNRQNQCRQDTSRLRKIALEPTGKYYPTDNDIKAYLQYQPVAASVNYPGSLSLYKSGVFSSVPGMRCSDSIPTLNHAVTIVGWSDEKSQGCNGHWIVKNSYGTNWGENGFVRLCITPSRTNAEPYGTCNINYLAFIVIEIVIIIIFFIRLNSIFIMQASPGNQQFR